jgi:hypothetical protein
MREDRLVCYNCGADTEYMYIDKNVKGMFCTFCKKEVDGVIPHDQFLCIHRTETIDNMLNEA